MNNNFFEVQTMGVTIIFLYKNKMRRQKKRKMRVMSTASASGRS